MGRLTTFPCCPTPVVLASVFEAPNGSTALVIANHGPPATADGGFEWAITSGIKITSAAELQDPQNGVRRVLEALAKATVEGGRVDLFACNLLASEEGKAVLKEIEAATATNFAASTNKTGNPTKDDSDWVMESDNVDVKGLYFGDTSVFDGHFEGAKLDWSAFSRIFASS